MAKPQVEDLFSKVSHSLSWPWEMWMSEECIDIHFVCLYIQIAYFSSVENWDKPLVVVQSPSRVQLSATPWTAAHQASLSIIISQSLLKPMSTEYLNICLYIYLCSILFGKILLGRFLLQYSQLRLVFSFLLSMSCNVYWVCKTVIYSLL